MGFLRDTFERFGKKKVLSEEDIKALPTSRSSAPEGGNPLSTLNGFLDFLKPEWDFESIALIRKLIRVNPNFSQALWNIIFLGNTGHKIRFDSDIKPIEVDKMREHIKSVSKKWVEGTGGADGIVNKMLAQIMIGGAISTEWVPKKDLTGIDKLAFVKVDNIRYIYNKATGRYEPYQKTDTINTDKPFPGYIKLNTNTYKYLALYSDSETPYGLPPFIAALEPVVTQNIMTDNVRKVSRQTSLMGFIKILLGKPKRKEGENLNKYKNRLEGDLTKAKERVAGGLSDGIVVGYEDDTDIDFQATTQSNSATKDIFNLNEQQMFSGLKSDGALHGRDFGSSETQITVVLTKLISELINIQNLVKSNLEFGYTLELALAGFNPKGLDIEFNKSTLLDELKMQQGREIKIKNLWRLYLSGVINLDQMADDLGYEKADRKTPRHLWEATDKPDEGQKGKDASRKKGDRQKKKTQEKKLTKVLNLN